MLFHLKNLILKLSGSPALRFVLMMGMVDLFGDMTYSGGAGMNGLFLGSLGATAAIISTAGGASEFLNYLIRGVSGFFADKMQRHWLLVYIGYVFNLLAVPAIALAGNWQIAAFLIILQGFGRGIRKPIVQSMLSHTTDQLGKGGAYGIHTALDHAGRAIGPLVIAFIWLPDFFTRNPLWLWWYLLQAFSSHRCRCSYSPADLYKRINCVLCLSFFVLKYISRTSAAVRMKMKAITIINSNAHLYTCERYDSRS